MEFNQEYLDELTSASMLKVAVYNYLYRVFATVPDREFIGITKQLNILVGELSEFLKSEKLSKAALVYDEYNRLEKNATDIDKFLESLNIEYTGLFLLGNNSVPTSASVHLSTNHLVKGKAWEDVVKIYKERSFHVPEHIKEPEDHIAVELLYLQKLNETVKLTIESNSIDSIEELLIEQVAFLEKIFLPWIGFFAEAIQKKANDTSSLYYASSLLLTEFVNYDIELLAELMS